MNESLKQNFANMNKVYILVSIVIVSFCFSYSEASRKITCSVNPDLNVTGEDRQDVNVVHIISEGDEDVVHFVWSTYNLPSVIVARTTKNTSLSINTTKLINFEKDAVSFKNGKPLEILGVTFSKFWELHYENDSSPIEFPDFAEDLNMESFHWSDVSDILECTNSFASVNIKGKNNELPFSKKGVFEIKFSVSADQELSDEFPHVVFTGNSTLLKFVLNNLHSNNSFTRYGFGMSLFSSLSSQCETDKWNKIITDSINDEVSPGVFSDVELLAPCSDTIHHKSAFLSWRPVAYTGVKPIVANSSDVTMSNMISSHSFDNHSIAELYFQEKSFVSNFNVTFGTLGDGCYVATKYTSWTLMAGTGSMVEIPLSTVVIILASLGIGLLVLFLLTGSIFIIFQKCRQRDDDLLLN